METNRLRALAGLPLNESFEQSVILTEGTAETLASNIKKVMELGKKIEGLTEEFHDKIGKLIEQCGSTDWEVYKKPSVVHNNTKVDLNSAFSATRAETINSISSTGKHLARAIRTLEEDDRKSD
jgi:hypothetical protein